MAKSNIRPDGRQAFSVPVHILPVYAEYQRRNGRLVTRAICGAESFEGSGHYNLGLIMQGVPINKALCPACTTRFNTAMDMVGDEGRRL